MYFKKTFLAALIGSAFFLLSIDHAQAQEASRVLFYNPIEKSGDYFGETDDGKSAMLTVQKVVRSGRSFEIEGRLSIQGRSSQVTGSVVSTPGGGAILYPVYASQLSDISSFAAGGPDYELSGARSGIYIEEVEEGDVTEFYYDGSTYVWDKEDRSYKNRKGFDKFQFWSNGDGTYKYKHTYESWGGGGGTHSKGTASPSV